MLQPLKRRTKSLDIGLVDKKSHCFSQVLLGVYNDNSIIDQNYFFAPKTLKLYK